MASVFFDFDGTIADSFELNVDIFCQITNRPHTHTQADIDRWRQMPMREVMRELHVSLWQIPILVTKWRRVMAQRMGEVTPFPDIPTILEKLRQSGHILSIVSTNSPQNIDLFLKNHGLHKFFSEIYGDIGFFGKRRTLRRVVKRNRLTPDDCFYIGDETRDVRAGNQVGMRTIAVAWGYTGEKPLRSAGPFAFAQIPNDLVGIISDR